MQTTLTNPAPLGQDKTFTAWAYLRTNWNSDSDPNLVGWWKLDESSGTTAADSSGNGNDGTLTNMVGDEWTTGQKDGALEFDGSNDYVAVAHADDFLIDNGTVALWFNSDDVSSRGELFSKDSSDYDTGGHLTIYVESSQVKLRLQSTSSDYELSSGSTLQDDTWYHVALCWGSAGVKLYINGTEVDTDPYTGGLGTTSGGIGNYEPLALGACTWGSGNLTITPLQYYFDGTLDDVRIYDYALSTEEISGLLGVTYQQFTEAKAASDTTSITISTPSDTNESDLLIAAVATDGDTAASLAPPGGEGWTEIDVDDYDTEATLGAWWKLAEASESATHEFTWTGDERAYGWMMRFTGHDPDDPVDVSATSGETSSTPTSPAVTSTVGNALILRLGAFDDSDITVDSPGLTDHTAITMDTSGFVGLVAQWKLDESSGTTATDSSGNGHDGTLTNMVGDEWTTGIVDGALEFDGSADYVSVANSSSLQLTSALTIAGWIKADSWDSGTNVDIIARKGEGNPNNYQLAIADGRATLYLDDSDNGGYRGDTVLNTGQWYHVAATWDGSTVRVYVNGVLDNDPPDSRTGTISTDTRPVYIGGRAGADLLDGILDDVRIYNYALSADEVVALYLKGGLVGHWKLDETSGTNASDSSGNGHDGTLTNMAGNEWTTGQVGGALEFDGTNDYINVGNIGTLSNDTYSISVWINVYIPAGDSRQEIVWGAVTDTSNERFRFEVRNNHINFHDDYNMDITAAYGELVSDTWYHVVAIYDYPNQNASVYVDGDFKRSDTSFSQASSTLGILTIATRNNGYYPDGIIDDVRIYDRVLSVDEITVLYNGEEPGGSGDPVSGGAGYVKQSTSGDSGTSDFALTASEESQMLTIAIAPETASGEGTILP